MENFFFLVQSRTPNPEPRTGNRFSFAPGPRYCYYQGAFQDLL
jgi:hypothetical protein